MEVFRPELHAWPLRAFLDEAREALGSEALESVLGRYQLTSQNFEDRSAWVSLEFVEAFLQDLVDSSQDPDFFDRATLRGMDPKYIGALYPLLCAFGSPLFTYNQLARAAGRFTKTGQWLCEDARPGYVRMVWLPDPEARHEQKPFICRTRFLQLGRVPMLFGQLPAHVEHPSCAVRGDDSCVYTVRWEQPAPRRDALVSFVAGSLLGVLLCVVASVSLSFAAVVSVAFGVCGWALARAWRLQQDLNERVKDIENHNQALDRVTRSNDERFAELLEAKVEVDAKVELRTLELREASRRLAETLEEIRALDRTKTDFFNNVSHELRSPLTLILAPLEDLAAGRSPPGGERAAFESMRRNAARLLTLINQLLDLAKIDAGQMEIAPTPTDLLALVRSTLTGFEAAAQKRDVRIEFRAPASLPSIVLDTSWIESAVTNLVANALRFTRPGGGVRVVIEDRGGDVALGVSDDGPGIAPEDQEKVFARFAQGDSSKRVVGGTGIGLALVREAARLHGGDVELTSELGTGTTFTLTLPRRPELAADTLSSRPQSQRPPADRPAPSLAMLEVPTEPRSDERAGPAANAPLALVVEDNAELCEFIADVLAIRYRVRTASDGARGASLARQLKPDVVVSDVAMPEMDGYELCRFLRAHEETRATPVLLVTARTEVSSVLKGFEAGANDYVLKPFHGRELLARVDVHVRLRRMVQEMALRERHAVLGVLAASVAHQVRNPLTTLVSGLPAMRTRIQDKIDPMTQDLIDVMIDCASRIERLTLDLMDLSRVDREAGGSYRPCEGLRAALRLIRARVDVAIRVEEQIEDCALTEGRAGDMNHVFLNLLDNAVRAAGTGGRIRVEAWNEGPSYAVRVGDSGPGVDPDSAKRIFEPFFTTRPAGEGTGLGLAIAQQVVQQNGGSIELGRSELGGAAFTVRIPMSATKASQPAQHDQPGVN